MLVFKMFQKNKIVLYISCNFKNNKWTSNALLLDSQDAAETVGYLPLVPLGSFHEEVIFMRPSSVLLLDHLHPLQLPEVVHQALCPVRS